MNPLDPTLLAQVSESNENAIDNGYDILAMNDYQIALDMGTYDADLEGREPDELVPYIADWRRTRAP